MFRKPEINALFIFGFLPWIMYSGYAILSYGLLLFVLLINNKLFSAISVCVLAVLTYFIVQSSPLFDALHGQQVLNSYNFTFGLFITILAFFTQLHIPIRTNRLIDILLWGFLGVTLAFLISGRDVSSIYQISSFIISAYLVLANTLDRKIFTVLFVFGAGARSIAAGFVTAWMWEKFKILRSALAWPILLLLILIVGSGAIFAVISEALSDLRSEGIFLKGRTTYWLALLETKPGFFGGGIGTSLLAIEKILGGYQLPHNDWLRIYTDYGVIALVLVIFALFKVSQRNYPSRIATVVLIFYMLTGNPLSFPPVITAFFLVSNSRSVTLTNKQMAAKRPSPARSRRKRLPQNQRKPRLR